MSKDVLHLVLTGFWFDEIDSGRKNVEYREFTPYWRRRISLMSKPKVVVFHRGYSRKIMVFAVKDILHVHDCFKLTDRFEIHLGERLRPLIKTQRTLEAND